MALKKDNVTHHASAESADINLESVMLNRMLVVGTQRNWVDFLDGELKGKALRIVVKQLAFTTTVNMIGREK